VVVRRDGIHLFCTLLLSVMTTFAAHTSAEIYKWVDADGKVHFGDKPREAAQASGAQAVELREGYQPPVRTPQEQEAYDQEQRAIELRSQMHRREAEKAEKEAQLERDERKAALCTAYQEKIDELEIVEVKDGVRTVVYVEGEDGQSVSSDRQREIIAELKAEKAAAGCR
jgi:Domain of unknown function (DUF4124)